MKVIYYAIVIALIGASAEANFKLSKYGKQKSIKFVSESALQPVTIGGKKYFRSYQTFELLFEESDLALEQELLQKKIQLQESVDNSQAVEKMESVVQELESHDLKKKTDLEN